MRRNITFLFQSLCFWQNFKSNGND